MFIVEVPARTWGQKLLFVVSAQKQFTFVVNDSQLHLIQPTASTEHVSGERFVGRKIDRDFECVVERFQC